MADQGSDSALKILIQMGYDPVAAKAALADLEQLKTRTKGAGTETDEYSKLLDKAGDSQKEFTLKGHETRMMFNQLNRIIPESGLLMRAAFLGPIGIILAVIVAIRGAISAFNEYNQRLDEIAKSASQPLDGGVKTLQDSWNSARTALGKYLAAMDTAGQDTDTTATLIKNAKEVAAAKIDAAKMVIEAEGALEEARLRAEGKSDLDISAAKAHNKALLDSLAQGKSVAALLAEQAVLQTPGMGASLSAATDQARKAASIPDLRAAQQREELTRLQAANSGTATEGFITQADIDKIEAAKRLRQVALAQVGVGGVQARGAGEQAKAEGIAGALSFGGFNPQFAAIELQKSIAAVDERLKAATERLATQRERQRQLEAEGAEVQKKKEEADAALASAVKAEETFRKRSVEVPIELSQAQKVASISAFGSSDAASVQRQTDLIKSGAMAHPQETFKAGEEAISDINKLVRTSGLSAAEIDARGKAAQIEQQNLLPGQELSPDKVKDIANFTSLQKDQDVIQALRDLDETLGINADTQIGTLNSIVSQRRSDISLQEAVRQELDEIGTALVTLKQRADEHAAQMREAGHNRS